MSEPDLANLLGALALAVGDAGRAAVEAAAGLPASGVAALFALGVEPGQDIGALAAVAGVNHSTMVRIVERLEAEGLVVRSDPAGDRRRVRLALAPEGEARRRAALAAREAALCAALAPLDAEDRASLRRALSAVLAGLTVGDAVGDRICRLCDEDACGPHCPVEARAKTFRALRS